MFAENLAVFMADFGVPCTCGYVNFTGILNAPDETLNMGGLNVLSTMYMLEARSADLAGAGIMSASALSVNGVAFTVRDVLSIDDGAITHLTLTKV
jgi:hypothetical protein